MAGSAAAATSLRFKALALGANAIRIGRPCLRGPGAFGRPGVESVLSVLRRGLETIMRQAGALGVQAIYRSCRPDHRCR